MGNFNKKWSKKVPVTTIDASLDKYSQDKRVLAKLQEDKEWLAKVGLPDLYYEEQAKIKAEKQQNLDFQKVNNLKINDDIKDYKNDKVVLKKLAMMNKIIEESGLPDAYYKHQARLLYDNQNTEELLVAHEPMPEYNAPKEEEK